MDIQLCINAMKRLISALLCVSMLFLISGCSQKSKMHQRLERNDWADDVKAAVNDMLSNCGVDSEDYKEDTYAVFDFDNTSSIFDVEDQLCIYQLEVMAFEIKPEQMSKVLFTDLSDHNADLTSYGLIKGSYNDIIGDIVNAYTYLYKTYGPFTAKGLDEAKAAQVQKDAQWLEFATKLRLLYELVGEVESSSIAYPWVLYWFYGMTEDEVYALAKKSHEKYTAVETSEVTWTSPDTVKSKIGSVSYTWTSGVGVTENMKELWSSLEDNGIDVWVCSASCTAAVRAAIDVCGLHDYITGMLAMTTKTDADGKFINAYDYETGCGYYAKEDGAWEKMTTPTRAQTFLDGKVTAITNAIAPEYNNHGPIAGFMDSTGDFNFCTEYKTLKLVCCFNRANRKITDGGGLIAEIAMYQKDTLEYTFEKASEAGDTLYVLQGRDENGMRAFRNSNLTLRYGAEVGKLFANDDNNTQLEYIVNNNMSVADALNTFAVKTGEDHSEFGIKYGFLDKYSGYHTHE